MIFTRRFPSAALFAIGNYSAERFANLVAEFRKSGAQILDINGPTMKGIVERLDKSLTELSQQSTEIDLSQPVNLGEFDTRPNVYSVMLLIQFKTKIGDEEASVPVLGGLSYVRVGQRLVYVYTYRKYKAADRRANSARFYQRVDRSNSRRQPAVSLRT